MKDDITNSRILSIWFVLLLLSFCYQKPILFLSSIDRINPRLFDIVSILGVLFYFRFGDAKRPVKMLLWWKYLVLWFCFLTIITIFFYDFPGSINQYVLFYCFKYIQGYFILLLVSKLEFKLIPLVIKTCFVGGVFVFVYCVFEFFYGEYGSVEFSPGKFVNKPMGVIWGPFGNTYFQIANYLPLLSSVIFGYSYAKKNGLLYKLFAVLLSFPLLFTGSRTGLGLLLVSLALITIFNKDFYFLFITAFLALIVSFSSWSDKLLETNTISRMVAMENNEHNSISDRVNLIDEFDISKYHDNGHFLPFFGGGIFVAPRDGKFRIGYGFHNIYVYVFEQSGVVGFLIFLTFIAHTIKGLIINVIANRSDAVTYFFVISVLCFFISQLITGVSAHSWWRGFATNDMNTLRLIILLIASTAYEKNTAIK
ncbi:O-antigen ligase family protein [Persicobacter diffluens]|uniref:O-antigen ligase-related domain-containing protein n=1 Tax=Persicobacter diffluens TaxID=981 RepID=A0AAN4VWP9_9BACT|nr:hypothetical protein PEDI_20510 [Persicobacter diffluens]